jgi:hypothetical protein
MRSFNNSEKLCTSTRNVYDILLPPHSQALSVGTVRDSFLFLLNGVASGETALSVATLRLFEAVVVLVKDAV